MKYSMSGLVDESVPDLSAYLEGLGINQADFVQWLGLRVGRYRMFQGPIPNAKEEKKALKNYIETLERLINYSEPGGLPPVAEALFYEKAYKHGSIDAYPLQQSILPIAYRSIAIAKLAQEELNSAYSRGAPKRTDRARLLSDVIDKLLPYCHTKTDARQRAAGILNACGVSVTSSCDPDNAERQIRRVSGKT